MSGTERTSVKQAMVPNTPPPPLQAASPPHRMVSPTGVRAAAGTGWDTLVPTEEEAISADAALHAGQVGAAVLGLRIQTCGRAGWPAGPAPAVGWAVRDWRKKEGNVTKRERLLLPCRELRLLLLIIGGLGRKAHIPPPPLLDLVSARGPPHSRQPQAPSLVPPRVFRKASDWLCRYIFF